MLGQTLAQYCGNDSAKMSAEQRRIEAELLEFEKHVWGDRQLNDSLGSVAMADNDAKSKAKTTVRSARTRSSGKTVKTQRTKSSSSSSSAARMSVRRQRH